MALLFLFTCNRQSIHQDAGAAEGGLAQCIGDLQVIGQGGDVLQQVVEVACHGEGLHRSPQLAVFDEEAGALQRKSPGASLVAQGRIRQPKPGDTGSTPGPGRSPVLQSS